MFRMNVVAEPEKVNYRGVLWTYWTKVEGEPDSLSLDSVTTASSSRTDPPPCILLTKLC